ncbi:MAG: TSCPD domain-containing protein, partial [Clostridia bacterium]|nr:TSCPD domain-containing protein [Clostridia bacterium]
MFTYFTSGTCSRQIIFEVDKDNKIHGVKFIGGCS